ARSTYLRLTTKTVDQNLMDAALQRNGEEPLRRQVLAGGYRLVDRRYDAADLSDHYVVQIVAAGAMIPEAIAAASMLHEEGVAANVINVTSPGLLYRGLADARRGHLRQRTTGPAAGRIGELILPDERRAPIGPVHDGAPHAPTCLASSAG